MFLFQKKKVVLAHSPFPPFYKCFSPKSLTQSIKCTFLLWLMYQCLYIHIHMWMIQIGLDKLVWKQHSLATGETETRHSLYANP